MATVGVKGLTLHDTSQELVHRHKMKTILDESVDRRDSSHVSITQSTHSLTQWTVLRQESRRQATTQNKSASRRNEIIFVTQLLPPDKKQ